MARNEHRGKQWEEKIKQLIGTKIGNWTIVDEQWKRKGTDPKTGNSTGRLAHGICDCGFEQYIDLIVLQKQGYGSCKNCANTKRLQRYQDIPVPYFTRLIREAKLRDLVFNITIQDLQQQWIQQKGICALSGVLIQFPPGSVYGRANKKGIITAQTASVDRIDPTKGYLKDNIQWVHKRINQMKSNDTNDDFFIWCYNVLKYNNLI